MPVLLVLPLLLSYRDRRRPCRFLLGLSIGVVPFLPILFMAGPSFHRNALAYGSNLERWGINFFLLQGEWSPLKQRAATAWHLDAKYLIVATILLWSIVARQIGRWNRYELAAITFAAFLVLTGGFGVQYTLLAGLPLFAVSPETRRLLWRVRRAVSAGTLRASWTGGYPIASHFISIFPMPAAALGLLPWGLLISFASLTLLKGWPLTVRSSDERSLALPSVRSAA